MSLRRTTMVWRRECAFGGSPAMQCRPGFGRWEARQVLLVVLSIELLLGMAQLPPIVAGVLALVSAIALGIASPFFSTVCSAVVSAIRAAPKVPTQCRLRQLLMGVLSLELLVAIAELPPLAGICLVIVSAVASGLASPALGGLCRAGKMALRAAPEAPPQFHLRKLLLGALLLDAVSKLTVSDVVIPPLFAGVAVAAVAAGLWSRAGCDARSIHVTRWIVALANLVALVGAPVAIIVRRISDPPPRRVLRILLATAVFIEAISKCKPSELLVLLPTFTPGLLAAITMATVVCGFALVASTSLGRGALFAMPLPQRPSLQRLLSMAMLLDTLLRVLEQGQRAFFELLRAAVFVSVVGILVGFLYRLGSVNITARAVRQHAASIISSWGSFTGTLRLWGMSRLGHQDAPCTAAAWTLPSLASAALHSVKASDMLAAPASASAHLFDIVRHACGGVVMSISRLPGLVWRFGRVLMLLICIAAAVITFVLALLASALVTAVEVVKQALGGIAVRMDAQQTDMQRHGRGNRPGLAKARKRDLSPVRRAEVPSPKPRATSPAAGSPLWSTGLLKELASHGEEENRCSSGVVGDGVQPQCTLATPCWPKVLLGLPAAFPTITKASWLTKDGRIASVLEATKAATKLVVESSCQALLLATCGGW